MPRPPYVSVHVPIPPGARRVSAQQIVEAFAAEIRAGRLPAGCRVPPVRALERQLGLSKNTVQVAYDELCARGLVETREREGVFVAAPTEATPVRPPPARPPLPRCKPVPAVFNRPAGGGLRLSSVFIDPELLPREQITDCIRMVLKQPGLESTYEGQGHPALREVIADRLRRRGMEVDAAQVITTIGSQQGIDIVCRSLEIRRVGLEDPVYPFAKELFARNGMTAIGLRLDPFAGIDLERWEHQLATERPGLVYAISSFQNPTGYSYSTHELTRLCELAEKHDFALLEDDWGSDMLSDSEYRPSLRMLAGEQVLYLNSFTKKVWPALRVGFLVAPAALVPTLVAAKRLSTLGSPALLEAAMAEFLGRGYYDAHLGRLQAELDRRYEACLEALRALMPERDDVRWTHPGGGPTLWLDLPRRVSLPALAAALRTRGVEIENAEVAFFGEPHLHGFRVGYAGAPIGRVRDALAAVAEELGRQLS
jgi:DNA-binding transcriptional MocR family regulator